MGLEDRLDAAAEKVEKSRFGKAVTGAGAAIKAIAGTYAGRAVAAAQAGKAAVDGNHVEAARLLATQLAAEKAAQATALGGALVNAGSSSVKNFVKNVADRITGKTDKSGQEPTGQQLMADAAAEISMPMAASKRRVVRRKAPVRRNTPARRPVGRRMRAAKVKVSRSGNNKAYCLRCRRKVQIVGPKMKRTKRGSPFLQGTCPHCSGKVACFQRK